MSTNKERIEAVTSELAAATTTISELPSVKLSYSYDFDTILTKSSFNVFSYISKSGNVYEVSRCAISKDGNLLVRLCKDSSNLLNSLIVTTKINDNDELSNSSIEYRFSDLDCFIDVESISDNEYSFIYLDVTCGGVNNDNNIAYLILSEYKTIASYRRECKLHIYPLDLNSGEIVPSDYEEKVIHLNLTSDVWNNNDYFTFYSAGSYNAGWTCNKSPYHIFIIQYYSYYTNNQNVDCLHINYATNEVSELYNYNLGDYNRGRSTVKLNFSSDDKVFTQEPLNWDGYAGTGTCIFYLDNNYNIMRKTPNVYSLFNPNNRTIGNVILNPSTNICVTFNKHQNSDNIFNLQFLKLEYVSSTNSFVKTELKYTGEEIGVFISDGWTNAAVLNGKWIDNNTCILHVGFGDTSWLVCMQIELDGTVTNSKWIALSDNISNNKRIFNVNPVKYTNDDKILTARVRITDNTNYIRSIYTGEVTEPIAFTYDGDYYYKVNADAINAVPNNVLSGKTFVGSTGGIETGTMNNYGIVNITPTTSNQIYNGGYYNSINIGAVTSSIDANITSQNIVNGVNILGVVGSFEGLNTADANATYNDIIIGKTAYVNGVKITGTMNSLGALNITPSTSAQSFSAGYYNSINISAVTNAIDPNITQANIRAGVTILGIQGNLEPDKPDQTKTVDPSILPQLVEPDTGYELASVTINAVTSNIDNNIVPNYILNGINILGVTGNLDPGYLNEIEYADCIDLAEQILGVSYNEETMEDLNDILDSEDDYGGYGADPEEIENVLDDILGEEEPASE